MTEFPWMARKVQDKDIDATSVHDGWKSTTSWQLGPVPATERWFFLGGMTNRDASGTVTIYIRMSGALNIQLMGYEGAATGIAAFPSASASQYQQPGVQFYIMDPGDYVDIVFGAAQGSGAYVSYAYLVVGV